MYFLLKDKIIMTRVLNFENFKTENILNNAYRKT